MRKFFSLFSLLSLLQRHVLPGLHDALVGRADDLIHVDKLLHAVGGPADDTRNRKDRGVQLHRDAQHVIHKAGVEVHVRRDLASASWWTKLLNTTARGSLSE